MSRSVLLVVGLTIFNLGFAHTNEIPAALDGWSDWVLRDAEFIECPFEMTGAFGEMNNHMCAWPGRLVFDAGAGGAQFKLEWHNYADSWISIPGDEEHWPVDVLTNGAPVPVVTHDGDPAIWVSKGRHSISGRLVWSQRPESIRIPTIIALVDLKLEGQRIFPLQRSGGSLWLGRPEANATAADALSTQVYRKLKDGLPPILETRLRLDVSGQGREETLGPVFPQGFAPIAISGELPVILESDGTIRVQLRPGNWDVTVAARGLNPLTELSVSTTTSSWPETEIWSFESAPQLRVTAISGGTSVDPSQVDVPEDWAHFPSIAVSDGTILSIEERSRGMADDNNRLSLEREIWLDFKGRGMTVRDTITGEMSKGFRLDIGSPFELMRAQSHDQALMVTNGGDGLTGVEIRNPSVDLRASARVATGSMSMPVTGWETSFESVYTDLNLPPGRLLIAAIGSDSCPQAWIEKWSLLDIFLLLITTMLAGRLNGAKWAIVTAAFLTLSYQETSGPLWCLLVLFGLSLLHRALSNGRFARVVGVLVTFNLIWLALVVLPFVALQLRLALYPQLEQSTVGSSSVISSLASQRARSDDMEEAIPNVEPQEQTIDYLTQSAAPMPKKMLQRYAASNIVQAGGGEPSWAWRNARMVWSGPVTPGQQLRLVMAPPWLTRLLRIVLVALLALVIVRVVRTVFAEKGVFDASFPAFFIIMLMMLNGSQVSAQETPNPALLKDLRQHLMTPPGCVPNCGQIESSQVTVRAGMMIVVLDIHAGARIAAPLPSAPASWRITEIRVDGQPRSRLVQKDEAELWIPLERGVHRVEMRGVLAEVDSIDLHFPTPPSQIDIRAPEWDAGGIRNKRLLTDTLGLIKIRQSNEQPGQRSASITIDPFVHIERMINLDLDWTVTTRVIRLAPEAISLSVELPLIDGEKVLTPGLETKDGHITISLAAGVPETKWSSRLERSEAFSLSNHNLNAHSETWLLTVSPQWSVLFEGVPATYPTSVGETGGYWVHEFHPLPGEKLSIRVDRPEAVSGATVAIDTVSLKSNIGLRASEHELNLDIRCTRGTQHSLALPERAEVLSVSLDGDNLNIRPVNGKLVIPIHPGEQTVLVRWRDTDNAGFRTRTPMIDLGSPASNLQLTLNLPSNRWVIATAGPRIGPAVLYWGELLVMTLVASLLARRGRSPLKLRHWMILGLGFSTFSWVALTFVAVWLLSLDARARLETDLKWWQFDMMQLSLFALSAIAMICLLIAIPYGLLGTPDMHVAGNGSSSTYLRWFDDKTDSAMPIASALSLPIFAYRIVMLAWALWLASTIITWLRWGWSCSVHRGGWMKPERKKKE